MTEQERVITKIQKILAIAENTPYEAEAQTAFAKAQELLAQHNLSMSEINHQAPEVKHRKIEQMRRIDTWKGMMASVISRNFRCRAYWVVRRGRKGIYRYQKFTSLYFIGFPDDVKVATEAYLTACDAMEHFTELYLHRRKQEEWCSTSETILIKHSYMEGFIMGLDSALRQNIQANAQEMALVMVIPKEVQEEADKTTGRRKQKSSAQGVTDYGAFQNGRRDGSSFDPTARRLSQ